MYILSNDAIRYVANFANSDDYDWMVVAGIVFDRQR